MQSLIIMLTAMFAFLILTETLSIRFTYSAGVTLEIGLNLLAISLSPSPRNHKSRRRKQQVRRKKRLIFSQIDLAIRWLAAGDLTLYTLELPGIAKQPSTRAISSGAYTWFATLVVSLLHSGTKKFTAFTISEAPDEHNNLKIDLELRLLLITALVDFIKVAVRVIYTNFREAVKKYVRKQNE